MILFSMEAKVEFAALIIFAGIPSGPGAAPAESIFMQSDTKGWASVTSVRHVSIGHLFGLETFSMKKSSLTLNSSIGLLATDSYCFLSISACSAGSSVNSPFSFTTAAISPLLLANFFA